MRSKLTLEEAGYQKMNIQVENIIGEIKARTKSGQRDSFVALKELLEELKSAVLSEPSIHLANIESDVSRVVSQNPECVRLLKEESGIADAFCAVLDAVEAWKPNKVGKPADIKPTIKIAKGLDFNRDRKSVYQKAQKKYEEGIKIDQQGRENIKIEVQNLLSLFPQGANAPTQADGWIATPCGLEFNIGRLAVRRTDDLTTLNDCGLMSMKLLQFIAERYPDYTKPSSLSENWGKFGGAEMPEKGAVRQGVSQAKKEILDPLGFAIELKGNGSRRILPQV